MYTEEKNIDITLVKNYNKGNVCEKKDRVDGTERKPWLRYEEKGFEAFEQTGAGRPHLRDGEDQSFGGCSGA